MPPAIVEYLKTQPLVKKLYHPSLPENQGHEIAARQQKGFGAMLSFELDGDEQTLRRFLSGLSLFTLAESLGGVESLISHAATMTHAGMAPEARAAAGISETLLRISTGIEDGEDLIADLGKWLPGSKRGIKMSVIAQAGAKGRQLHKFGGSSLADAKCYLRVAGIMKEYSQAGDMMVVSAAGSTTNQLISWLKLSQSDRLAAHQVQQSLRRYHTELIGGLLEPAAADTLIAAFIHDLERLAGLLDGGVSEAVYAEVVGHGEVWSARLMAAVLNQLGMEAASAGRARVPARRTRRAAAGG